MITSLVNNVILSIIKGSDYFDNLSKSNETTLSKFLPDKDHNSIQEKQLMEDLKFEKFSSIFSKNNTLNKKVNYYSK